MRVFAPATNTPETPTYSYGPFTDWNVVGMATGPNDKPRVLWRRNDGQAAIWRMTPQGQWGGVALTDSVSYGPYPGWYPRAITVDATNKPWILWNNSDGRINVWLLSEDGLSVAQRGSTTLPSPAYASKSISTNGLGSVKLLSLSASDVRTFTFPANNLTGALTYNYIVDLPTDWTPVGLTSGSDNVFRLLWTKAYRKAQTNPAQPVVAAGAAIWVGQSNGGFQDLLGWFLP